MKNLGGLVVAAAVAGTLGTTAFAQVATTQLQVQMTIQAECVVDVPEPLDFGAQGGVLAANVDSTSQIEVTCTSGTPYDLALDAGAGPQATIENRYMTSAGGDALLYTIYQDPSRAEVWGIGDEAVSAAGTGMAVAHTVYGRVPPQAAPPPGAYSDLITVTVNY